MDELTLSSKPNFSGSQRTLIVILVLAFFAFSTLTLYKFVTSRGPVIVWDIHSSWVGMRGLFYDGVDPYSEEVTASLQAQVYGRPPRSGENQMDFAYPLHVMALVGPLALLPLPLAQALWLSVIIFSMLLLIVVAPRAVAWKPSLWLLALTALFTLGLYSNAWAMLLGQIAVPVAAFVALSWWALRSGHWRMAGVFLALATFKPQISLLLVPGLLLWALYERRWQFMTAFFVTFGVLILLPVPWLPTWPLSWLTAASRYYDYTIFEAPLAMVVGSGWLSALITALLLIWTATRWRRASERQGAALDWLLAMLVVLSALFSPRTSHVNQVVLLLPLFFVFNRLSRSGVIAVIEIGLLVSIWLIDLTLLPPTTDTWHFVAQHRIISPILPLGLLLALLLLTPRLAVRTD